MSESSQLLLWKRNQFNLSLNSCEPEQPATLHLTSHSPPPVWYLCWNNCFFLFCAPPVHLHLSPPTTVGLVSHFSVSKTQKSEPKANWLGCGHWQREGGDCSCCCCCCSGVGGTAVSVYVLSKTCVWKKERGILPPVVVCVAAVEEGWLVTGVQDVSGCKHHHLHDQKAQNIHSDVESSSLNLFLSACCSDVDTDTTRQSMCLFCISSPRPSEYF